MTGLDVRVEADVNAVMESLDKIIAASGDFTKAWSRVGQEFWVARERNVFETNGLRRWAPLKFATLKAKKKEGSTLPMIRTGTVFRQLTSPIPKAAGARYAVFGPDQPAPYMKYHLQGGRVPQRNPVPKLTTGERVRIVGALRAQFNEEMAKGGGPGPTGGWNPLDGPPKGRT